MGPSLCWRYYGARKVQRRAARWVLNDYGRFSSVSSVLNQLSWPTLQSRRKLSRFTYIAIHCTKYFIINYLCRFLRTIYLLIYLQYDLQLTISSLAWPDRYFIAVWPHETRQYHPLHYILPCSSTTAHQNSYFPSTI